MPSDKFLPTAITRPTAPTLNKPYLRTPYLYKTGFPTRKPKNYLFDYNDPYEDNSLLDVVVNAFDSENPFKYVIDGGFDLIKRGTIDPIRAGHFGTAALNNLMMFAETMDVVAAPTKALLQGKGLDAAAKAWGIGTHGRYNYAWDTGNIISDIMLEVLTDPINWVTLGLKGAVTGAAKSTIKKGAREAALLTTFTDDSVYRKLSHQLVKSYLKQDTPQMMVDAKRLYTQLEKSGKVKLADGNTIDDMVKILQKAEAVAKESPGYTINKSLNRLVGGVESFERGLFRAAFTPSGLYPSWFLMKKGYTAANLMLKNRIYDVLKHYQRPDGTYSLSVISDLMATTKDVNDVFEALTKIKEGTEDIPKETIHALQKGVRNDIINLTVILREHKDDLPQLEAKLQEYMQAMNGVKTLEEYLETIKAADQLLKGEFHWAAKEFESLLEYRQALHNYEQFKFISQDAKMSQEYLGDVFYRHAEELGRLLDVNDDMVRSVFNNMELPKLLGRRIPQLRTPKKKWLTDKGQKILLKEIMEQLQQGYFAVLERQLLLFFEELPDDARYALQDIYLSGLRRIKTDIQKEISSYLYKFGEYTRGKADVPRFSIHIRKDSLEKAHDKAGAYIRKNKNRLKEMEDKLKDFESSKMFEDLLNGPSDMKKVAAVIKAVMNSEWARVRKMEVQYIPNAQEVITRHQKFRLELQLYLKENGFDFSDGTDPHTQDILLRFQETPMVLWQGDQYILNEDYTKVHRALSRWINNQRIDLMRNVNVVRARIDAEAALFRSTHEDLRHIPETPVEKYIAEVPEPKSLLVGNATPISRKYKGTGVRRTLEEWEKESELFEKKAKVSGLTYGDISKMQEEELGTLRSLQQKLEALAPPRISDVAVDLSQVKNLVGLKMESSHIQLNLSVLGPVGEFMRAVQAPETPIGKFVQSMKALEHKEGGVPDHLLNVYDASRRILEAAEKHNIYADTLAKLAANPEIMSRHYRSAFVSTLQGMRFQRMDPEFFAGKGPIVEEFLKQMELNMRSLYSNTRYNLESIRAYVDEWGKGLDEGAVNKVLNDAHTADADAYTLAMYMMATHKSEIQQHLDDGKMVWFVDIETTGLFANNKEILEIAGSTPGGQTFCYTRNLTQAEADAIGDDLIKALFGHLPENEQRAAFNKRYVRPQEIPTSEADILTAYFKEVTAGPGGVIPTRPPVIYAHYGDGFDFPFILQRAKSANVSTAVPEAYHAAEMYDTMRIMLSSGEAVHLSSDARELITEVLSNHGYRMLDAGGYQMVDNAAGESLDGLRDIAAYIRERMQDSQDADFLKEQRVLYAQVETAASEILTVLQSASRANGDYKTLWIADPFAGTTAQTREAAILRLAGDMGKTPQEIKNMFGYGAENVEIVARMLQGQAELKTLLDLDPKTATKAEIMQAVYRKFGDNINLPRLLSWGTPRGSVNYRKLIEMDLVQKYFTIDITQPPLGKRMEALSRIAKQLERQYTGVKNMNLIEHIAPKVDQALKEMRNSEMFMRMNPATADILRTLNWETQDPVVKFLLLKRMIQRNWAVKDPGAHIRLDPELETLIKDPIRIFHKSVFQDTSTQYEVLTRRASTELESSPGVLMDAISELDLRVKSLEDLGRELDNGISASKVFAVANALQGITKAKRYIQKLDPEQQTRLGRQLHDYKNAQGIQQIVNLLSDTLQNPRHLLSTLVWEAPVIRYSTRHMDRFLRINRLTKDLLARKDELEALGIQLVEGKEMMFIYLKDAATGIKETKHKLKYKKKNFTRSYMGQDVEAPTHRELPDLPWTKGDHPELEAMMVQARKELHQLSQGRSVGSTAELMTPKRFEEYYNKLPKDIQQGMGDLDLLLKDEKWQGMRYDWTNLGTAEVKRGLDDFAYKTPLGALSNALEYTAALTESKALYLDLYFNPSTGINTGLLKDAADQDIVDALKRNPEFILAALVTSKSKASDGYRVVRLDVNTADDVAKARKLNATILPYQVFATSHQTLNTGQFSSTFLNFWHKIIYTYKVGYLLDPGVILRNYVDSFAKNVVSDDGNIREVAMVQGRAMRMLNQYNKSLQAILALGHQKYNPDNLHLYFSKINPEDSGFTEEQFRFIHGFIAYSASAGMTGPWQKYLKDRNLAAGLIDEEHNVWNSFVAFSDFLMTPNKWTEQINRLTQYMILEEQGYTRTQIFKKIADTHFDYNVKTVSEMYAELVFPFYTFTMRNLEYWINAVSQKPWLMNMFKDIMTPIWNFDGYTQDELGRNRSLQYQLLAGNLAPFEDNGFTIKLNPSYMDVYNMAVDVPNSMLSLLLAGELSPEAFGSIIGKMTAPMQLGVDLGFELRGGMAAGLFDLQSNSGESTLIDTLVNTLPVIGAAKIRYEQGGKYAERTGFDWQKLPLTQGTFGGTQRWEPRKPYVKKQKNYYYDKGDTSSGYTYRTYHRKYYPSNYPARGRNLYYDSFYKKHYTKTGLSKFKLRMMPLTGGNLAYRIKDMYWYFK